MLKETRQQDATGLMGVGRRFLLAALFAATLSQGALGQGMVCDDYDIEHEFEWTVQRGANVIELTAKRFCHGWVKDVQRNGPDCEDHESVPAQADQPADWNPFGRDHIGRNGTVRTARTSSGSIEANVKEDVYTVDAGTPALAAVSLTETADAMCNSTAEANSSIEIDAFALGDDTVTGTIRSWGEACAILPEGWRSARAYAFSMSAVEARGGKENGRGRIRWGKRIRVIVAEDAEASARRQVDPIEYRATNLATGEVIEGDLLSIYFDIASGQPFAGGFIWENDLLITDVQDGQFVLDLGSPYITGGGTLEFTIESGVVTAASASGSYAGLAPNVGDFVPLVLPVPNFVEFDYELPIFNNGDDYEIELTFGGGGASEAELGAPSCPADLDGDGVVGSPDLAALLGVWGGGPETCNEGNPCTEDLNQDGFVNAADLAVMLGSWGPCPDGSGGPGGVG